MRHTRVARRVLTAALAVVGILLAASALVVLVLRWADPPTSAFMLEARAAEGPLIHQHWVPIERISPWLALAVVASEDQRFPNHFGFDLEAIAEALHEHAEGEGLRGASTISQQVAKNLFLWPGRNLVRKGIEAWFTVLLETFWSKRRILEVYLNIAQFGPRTFGAGAAAERYFHQSPARLSRRQAARMAVVLPDPDGLSVSHPSSYVLQRERWVLGQMSQLGGRSYLADMLSR